MRDHVGIMRYIRARIGLLENQPPAILNAYTTLYVYTTLKRYLDDRCAPLSLEVRDRDRGIRERRDFISLGTLRDAAIEISFQANCEIPRILSTVGMYLSSAVLAIQPRVLVLLVG